MKIHGGRPPENAEVVRFQKAGKNGQIGPAEQSKVTDKVDLSGKAKEISDIMGAIRALPDVRAEKVAEIRERIETGKYAVEPQKIAQRMIDEIV